MVERIARKIPVLKMWVPIPNRGARTVIFKIFYGKFQNFSYRKKRHPKMTSNVIPYVPYSAFLLQHSTVKTYYAD